MPIVDVNQNTNKQHAVPQNIMDVEFKIVGELTLRQFFYLIVFEGIAYMSFVYISGLFRFPIALVMGALGVGVAFIPIEERGLDQWIVNFFKAVYSPTQRVWRKDPEPPNIFMYQNLALVRQELITLAPTSSRRKLEEYLETQNKQAKPDRLDIPEMAYMKLVKESFVQDVIPAAPAVDVAQPYLDNTTRTQPTVLQSSAPAQIPTVPVVTILPKEEVHELRPPIKDVPVIKPAPVEQLPVSELSAEISAIPTKPIVPETTSQVRPASVVSYKVPEKHSISLPVATKKQSVSVSPLLTPDRRAGRVFTNLTPGQGQIILPIRGEKVLKTSAEEEIEEDITEKTLQLQQLINQIKKDEQYKHVLQAMPTTVAIPDKAAVPQEDYDKKIQGEHQLLTDELQKLKEEIERTKMAEFERVEKLKILQKLEEDHAQLVTPVAAPTVVVKRSSEYADPAAPTFSTIQPLTTKPNTISGIVKNFNGNVLEGVILIIKNDHNEPVRALKTNSLGQFAISAPLVNGIYTIEIDKAHKTGLKFDIISVEANGNIIPPMEFVGK